MKTISPIFILVSFLVQIALSDAKEEPSKFPSYLYFDKVSSCAIVQEVNFPESGPSKLVSGSWFKLSGKTLSLTERNKEIRNLQSEITKISDVLSRPWSGGNLVNILFSSEIDGDHTPIFICSIQTSTPEILQFYKVSVVEDDYLGVKLDSDICEVVSEALSNKVMAVAIDLILKNNRD